MMVYPFQKKGVCLSKLQHNQSCHRTFKSPQHWINVNSWCRCSNSFNSFKKQEHISQDIPLV